LEPFIFIQKKKKKPNIAEKGEIYIVKKIPEGSYNIPVKRMTGLPNDNTNKIDIYGINPKDFFKVQALDEKETSQLLNDEKEEGNKLIVGILNREYPRTCGTCEWCNWLVCWQCQCCEVDNQKEIDCRRFLKDSSQFKEKRHYQKKCRSWTAIALWSIICGLATIGFNDDISNVFQWIFTLSGLISAIAVCYFHKQFNN